MSESNSDVTLCSQEDIVRQSQRFESRNTEQTQNIDHDFLIKVREEIWEHIHKVKFMNKRKATHYLMKLSQFESSQKSEYLSVARSIRFLKKIIATLEDLERLSVQDSQDMEPPARLPSQFSVGSDIAALENINNPVQYDNLALKLPADVKFTSSMTSTFPESMLTNKNFIRLNDSGISIVESEFSGQAAKKSKTSFGAVKKYSNTEEEVKRKGDFVMLETPPGTSEETQVEMTNIEKKYNPNSDKPENTNEDSSSDEDEFGNIESLMKMKNTLEEMITRFQVLFTKEVEEFEKVKTQELEAKKKKKKKVNPFFYDEAEDYDVDEDSDDDTPACDLTGLSLYYQEEYRRLFPEDQDE